MSETDARPEESDDYDIWFREQVEKGLKSAREGKLVTNEEVDAAFAGRRKSLRLILKGKNRELPGQSPLSEPRGSPGAGRG